MTTDSDNATLPTAAAVLTAEQVSVLEQRAALVRAFRRAMETAKAEGRPKMQALQAFLADHPEVSRSSLYHWDRLLRQDQSRPRKDRVGLAVLLDGRLRPAQRGIQKTSRGLAKVVKQTWATVRAAETVVRRLKAAARELETLGRFMRAGGGDA